MPRNRKPWVDAELAFLAANYVTASRAALVDGCGHPWASIIDKASRTGLARGRPRKKTEDEIRQAKREAMAKRRAERPDLSREYQRNFYRDNRTRQAATMRAYYARRFFWGRAMKLRGDDRATARDLARLWRQQGGRCALTGRRLDRSAQVDHILPRACGGSDAATNVRWLCPEANMAKRALPDAEFVALCSDVMAHIGRAIQRVTPCAASEAA